MNISKAFVINKTDSKPLAVKKLLYCMGLALSISVLLTTAIVYSDKSNLMSRYEPFLESNGGYYSVISKLVDSNYMPIRIRELADDTSYVDDVVTAYTNLGYKAVFIDAEGGAFISFFSFAKNGFTKQLIILRDIKYKQSRFRLVERNYYDINEMQYKHQTVEDEFEREAPRYVYNKYLQSLIKGSLVAYVKRDSDLDVDKELNQGNKYVFFSIDSDKTFNAEKDVPGNSYDISTYEMGLIYTIHYDQSQIIEGWLILLLVVSVFPITQFLNYLFSTKSQSST